MANNESNFILTRDTQFTPLMSSYKAMEAFAKNAQKVKADFIKAKQALDSKVCTCGVDRYLQLLNAAVCLTFLVS